jgi:predicted Mrr-cat superfamily restriction endonuclease
MWRILHHNSAKIANQAPEEVSLEEEEEEEEQEDLRRFKIMIQEIHTSIADTMEWVTIPKLAQKPKRT